MQSHQELKISVNAKNLATAEWSLLLIEVVNTSDIPCRNICFRAEAGPELLLQGERSVNIPELRGREKYQHKLQVLTDGPGLRELMVKDISYLLRRESVRLSPRQFKLTFSGPGRAFPKEPQSATTFENLDLKIIRTSNRSICKIESSSSRRKREANTRKLFGNLIKATQKTFTSEPQEEKEQAAITLGLHLFDSLFGGGGPVFDHLMMLIERTQCDSLQLRIRLNLDDAPLEWLAAPWEYLYIPGIEQFAALHPGLSLVRASPSRWPMRERVQGKLRVLVGIASPNDLPPLDTEKEQAALKAALPDESTVAIDWLPDLTFDRLREHLEKHEKPYHVFHFIGHAVPEGLAFETEQKRSRIVSGGALSPVIGIDKRHPLQLIFLNACNSGTAAGGFFSSTAATLFRTLRCPAAISMNTRITDGAAIIAAREFYERLIDGHRLDDAVRDTRLALHTKQTRIEWGTLQLWMSQDKSMAEGHLFEFSKEDS